MSHATVLVGLTLGLAACGEGRPTPPDPGAIAEALSEGVQTDHVSFHFSPGDRVDSARQEAHYAWAAPLLGVSLPSRLQYFKYRDRDQMARLTGQSANGFADPERLEVHAIFEWDAHEAVHVYSALLGRPSDFFNEGLAVALATDPLGGRLTGTYSGEPVHDWARRSTDQLRPIEEIATTGAFRALDEFLGYQEAGSFVEYLLESAGEEPVRELFRRGRRDDSLDQIRESFEGSFGFSLTEAERRWRAFLDGGA